jgi:hypothetical protein
MMSGAEALREIGLSEAVVSQVLQDQPEERVFHELAFQRKRDRLSDPDWTARFLSGGAAEKREMSLINIILSGGIKEATA